VPHTGLLLAQTSGLVRQIGPSPVRCTPLRSNNPVCGTVRLLPPRAPSPLSAPSPLCAPAVLPDSNPVCGTLLLLSNNPVCGTVLLVRTGARRCLAPWGCRMRGRPALPEESGAPGAGLRERSPARSPDQLPTGVQTVAF